MTEDEEVEVEKREAPWSIRFDLGTQRRVAMYMEQENVSRNRAIKELVKIALINWEEENRGLEGTDSR